MIQALVTGAEGFVGGHLVPLLLECGRRVCGTSLEEKDIWRVERFEGADGVGCDITEREAIGDLVERTKPREIYHLAAQSSSALSFSDPYGTTISNLIGCLNLLEAVRREEAAPQVLIVSTGEVYGRASPEPLSEDAPLRPINPYAASKASAEIVARQYHESFGLPVVLARPFNHTGPGQSSRFALSSFARQVAEAEQGLGPARIQVGDLEVRRDFLDVRDVVQAYVTALAKGVPGETYNISSGETSSLRDLLDLLLGLAHVRIEVEVSQDRLRRVDIPVLCGDSSKLRAQTGWSPRFTIAETMRDLLDHWRHELQDSAGQLAG
jgi:GDP-4-dehydro-6-deoxy-D-mannose reductase